MAGAKNSAQSKSLPKNTIPPAPTHPLGEDDKIISKEKRGDLGAMADALNEIHFMVRNNQQALYTQFTQFSEQFTHLNSRVDKVNSGMDTAHQRIGEHDKAIKSLKADKAAKSEVKTLELSIAEMREEFENKLETSEKQQTSLFMKVKEQERSLKNLELELELELEKIGF